LNVVTERKGFPAAVLIRALDPILGVEQMRERRRGREPLASGPGRVGQALGISMEHNHHPFSQDPLLISPGWEMPGSEVGVSGRIGIREASDWPLRFFVRGHPDVSGTPR
jgi:DNA-3-methyladenine glycosylase